MGDIILCGDLNARTGREHDYVPFDSTAHVPISDGYYHIEAAVNKRLICDSVVDTRGKDVIYLCVGNKLRIVNGRTLGDITGRYTCFNPTGCTVVDYFIVSEELLSKTLYLSFLIFW